VGASAGCQPDPTRALLILIRFRFGHARDRLVHARPRLSIAGGQLVHAQPRLSLVGGWLVHAWPGLSLAKARFNLAGGRLGGTGARWFGCSSGAGESRSEVNCAGVHGKLTTDKRRWLYTMQAYQPNMYFTSLAKCRIATKHEYIVLL